MPETHIKVNIPDANTPGALARRKKYMALGRMEARVTAESKALDAVPEEKRDASYWQRADELMGLTETYMERQTDMLLDYIVEPADRDEARLCLDNASQAELDDLLAKVNAVFGVGKAETGSQAETATNT